MNRTVTFHCFFEQSGTFRDVFRKMGHKSYDYDIQNEYDTTDFQIDLFKEINQCYESLLSANAPSGIFAEMRPETDFIMAFFPCTYFSVLNELIFKRYYNNKRMPFGKDCVNKLIARNMDRAEFFNVYLRFLYVVSELKIPTVIENPYSASSNYLLKFSPIDCAYTDKDRSQYGDKFVKPTCYWSVNFEMKENFIFYDKNCKTKKVYEVHGTKKRSEIAPKYAYYFYQRFLEEPDKVEILPLLEQMQ